METTATISNVLDTATDQTRDLVGHAGGIASELADVARGITVAGAGTAKLTRRAKRHARKSERRGGKTGRSLVVRVIVLAAIGVGITVFVRQRQAKRKMNEGPAPDAFGAAVRAEREYAGNGSDQPIATPGA